MTDVPCILPNGRNGVISSNHEYIMDKLSSPTRPASQEEQTDVASPSDLRLVAAHRREVGGSLSPLAARIDHLADALDALREAAPTIQTAIAQALGHAKHAKARRNLHNALAAISTLTGVTTHE